MWGLSQGKPVYPVDWWSPGNDRKTRRELARRPEFQEKQARLERLRADNPTIRTFEKKYGDLDRDTSLGYRFWNGDEYAQYFAESYRLEVEVYGDSPFNLHYVSRNAHMMELIWAVIAQNPGRRLAVLTGSEHKHVFDRELAESAKVRLVTLDTILPLSERALSRPIQASAASRFEEAWLHFLHRDYSRAIAAYAVMAARIEAGKVTKPFYRSETYVNLGRSIALRCGRGLRLSCCWSRALPWWHRAGHAHSRSSPNGKGRCRAPWPTSSFRSGSRTGSSQYAARCTRWPWY